MCDVSEATERILRLLNVCLVHRPEVIIQYLLMQPKGPLSPVDKSGVVYRVKCLDCPANYSEKTDKRLKSRMHEHTLAVKRSHVAIHNLEANNRFGFDSAQLVSRAEIKMVRNNRGLAIGCQFEQLQELSTSAIRGRQTPLRQEEKTNEDRAWWIYQG
ncbi:unnamed protein product [Schistocephalus solidus]|uniref:C2H2-type domain-containing protein n=1 Tax=Schistocephalus solidus TaxID=70667 RepID=A0A183SWN0_SCHSO|nr:unnamed protein product [Schistocephalus solidus]